MKISKPGLWLAGSTAVSQSEAMLTNMEFNMDVLSNLDTMLTKKAPSKLCITSALCWQSTNNGWIPQTKGQ